MRPRAGGPWPWPCAARAPRWPFPGPALAQAPVTEYPRLFSWLWDHAARRQDWQDDLGARHYSLSEWVWATRTLPARLLGLKDRGRLSPGARADVAIYDVPTYAPPGQWRHYLGRCRTLLKAGEVVVDNYSLVNPEVPRATYYRQTGGRGHPHADGNLPVPELAPGKPLGPGRSGRTLGGSRGFQVLGYLRGDGK